MAQGGPIQYPNGRSLYDQEPDLLAAWNLIWQVEEKHRKDEETKAKRKNKKGKGPR